MIHATRHPAEPASQSVRRAALRWVALAVLVAFVLFMVLGWAHAAGVLGDVHGHDHTHGGGHDHGGDLGHGDACHICDALVLSAGAALFVALVTFLGAARASSVARWTTARVRIFEPRRFAAPRGPPAS